MKLAMLYVLIFPLLILGFAAWSRGRAATASRRSTTPGRTASPRSSTRTPAAPATTARPSPGSTPTRPGGTSTLGLTMLVGRFLMIVPVLAIAGSMVDKKTVPPGPGTFPTNGALFTGLLVGVIVIVGALTFFPALCARARSSSTSWRSHGKVYCDGDASKAQDLALRSGDLSRRRSSTASASSPRGTSRRTRSCSWSRSAACSPPALVLRDLVARAAGARRSGSPRRSRVWLWFTVLFANFAEAVAEGRGKAQAASLRKMRKETTARRLRRRPRGGGAGVAAAQGRRGRRRGRRAHPRRRRGHRRHRLGRRVGDHRRVGAGHPRERRRSLGGHRRHQGALRPHRRAHHAPNPGRVVPRPHDRAGRGRGAAEDAERDRAAHPARRPDDRLPVRLRDAGAARRSTRACTLSATVDRRAARLPDPDHHRRAALGHRHRRHGPPAAQERDRDERPRGRGGRRRRHAAARQDRHHHARQPHGDRAHPGCRASRVEELADAAQLAEPGRRDARRAARSSCWSRSSYGLRGRDVARARRALHPLHARRRA